MSTLIKSLAGLGLGAAMTLTAGNALAAGGGGCGTLTNADGVEEHLACSTAPIDFTNKGSLQNGAKIFMNYCAGCHSAQYVRHSRISQDLDIPPELVEKYLMVTTDQIGDHIDAEIDPDVQASWFGAAPPDLSLENRLQQYVTERRTGQCIAQMRTGSPRRTPARCMPASATERGSSIAPSSYDMLPIL